MTENEWQSISTVSGFLRELAQKASVRKHRLFAIACCRRIQQLMDEKTNAAVDDALEDAGCDHIDILEHCRGEGPHVRGCWVVDLILGKS